MFCSFWSFLLSFSPYNAKKDKKTSYSAIVESDFIAIFATWNKKK